MRGYDFISERILTSDKVSEDIQGSYAAILQHAFNSPVVVHDYMAFAMLNQKFKTNMLVIYCDPKHHPKEYRKILASLVRARKQMPINLKPDDSGGL